MTPYWTDGQVTLHHGDALDVLRGMPDASVDAVVTDPPYGLEFMGREWDSFRPDTVTNRGGVAPGRSVEQEGRWVAVEYGTAKRRSTLTCDGCGKSDKFKNPHACPEGTGWSRVYLDGSAHNTATMRAFQSWCETWATECLRVLKPGGHLLAFGGTRTWHRLACAIEDAGFEVRDSIAWLYGSGFPKSLDVGKAIDRAAGAEREVVGLRRHARDGDVSGQAWAHKPNAVGPEYVGSPTIGTGLETLPATDDARTWQGWGTALKPSHESIVVARKPLSGTVAENVLTYGTGALNIAACRVEPANTMGASWESVENLCVSCAEHAELTGKPGTSATKASTATRHAAQTLNARDATNPAGTSKTATGCSNGTRAANAASSSNTAESGKTPTGRSLPGSSSTTSTTTPSTTGLRTCSSCGAKITPDTTPSSGVSVGRWPPNTLLSGDMADALDEQSGTSTSVADKGATDRAGHPDWRMTQGNGYGDSGGASRFFPTFRYQAKAPASERPRVVGGDSDGRVLDGGLRGRIRQCNVCETRAIRSGEGEPSCGHGDFRWAEPTTNTKHVAHPTVKPLDLMRWLVRLVTPPGGTILDPFAGSGTTGEAAILEHFRAILIEREADYLPLILARLTKPLAVGFDFGEVGA